MPPIYYRRPIDEVNAEMISKLKAQLSLSESEKAQAESRCSQVSKQLNSTLAQVSVLEKAAEELPLLRKKLNEIENQVDVNETKYSNFITAVLSICKLVHEKRETVDNGRAVYETLVRSIAHIQSTPT